MSLERETLLDNRNSSPKRLPVNNEFIESSRRRRFRFFSALLILCFLGYLFTSTVFLAENRKIDPVILKKHQLSTPISGKSHFESTKASNDLVPELTTKIVTNTSNNFTLLIQTTTRHPKTYFVRYSTTESDAPEILTEAKEDPMTVDITIHNKSDAELRDSDQRLRSPEIDNSLKVNTTEVSLSLNSTVENNFTSDKYDRSSIIANSIDKIDQGQLGQACIIPQLDPFHSSIKKALYEKVKKELCQKKFPLMFDTDLKSNLIQVREPKSLKWDKCCYRVITRTKTDNNPDDTEKAGANCQNITKKITKISQGLEFIGIYCTPDTDNNITTNANEQMVDAFAFIHLKPDVEKRIAEGSANNSKSRNQVNVVILGLDAVSHMNLKRIMPKVQKYLTNDLNAVSMNGYTKIGDNTYPNIVAALTSWNSTEILKICEKRGLFDDCPFLWKNFSQEGYRTSYGEDSAWMGIFNYLKNGFKNAPTDYYLRPIARAMGNLIAHDHRGNAKLCYGPRMTIDVILNYMKKLASTMGHDKRYFQFLWSTALTHDFVNQGKLGESSVLSTLKWFKEQSYLNRTVFIFMSDHGIRWGPVRELKQGKIEENMPFLYFVFPEWFKRKYKSAVTNIKANKNRLTSPYDTFETLKDLLYMDTISETNLKARNNKLDTVTEAHIPRGISLFLPIPKFRTCKMAGIAEHYCVCHTSKSVSTKNAEVNQAANYAVYMLNSYVSKFSNCAYLALASVMHAQINLPQNNSVINRDKIFEFAFTTNPGKGLFEATVVKNSKGNWAMSGTISRTNLYGNQSHCISDKEMKKFCYCIQS